MEPSELLAKLEQGFVLEHRSAYASDESHFMGFYRAPAYEYNGVPVQAAHYRFGWGSALGTTDEVLLSLIKRPENWQCKGKKPADYSPQYAL